MGTRLLSEQRPNIVIQLRPKALPVAVEVETPEPAQLSLAFRLREGF